MAIEMYKPKKKIIDKTVLVGVIVFFLVVIAGILFFIDDYELNNSCNETNIQSLVKVQCDTVLDSYSCCMKKTGQYPKYEELCHSKYNSFITLRCKQ